MKKFKVEAFQGRNQIWNTVVIAANIFDVLQQLGTAARYRDFCTVNATRFVIEEK